MYCTAAFTNMYSKHIFKKGKLPTKRTVYSSFNYKSHAGWCQCQKNKNMLEFIGYQKTQNNHLWSWTSFLQAAGQETLERCCKCCRLNRATNPVRQTQREREKEREKKEEIWLLMLIITLLNETLHECVLIWLWLSLFKAIFDLSKDKQKVKHAFWKVPALEYAFVEKLFPVPTLCNED